MDNNKNSLPIMEGMLYTSTRIAKNKEGQTFCDLANYFNKHADLKLILPSGMIKDKKCVFCKQNTLLISEDKFIWYCNPCHKGGDINSYMQYKYKLTPIETILRVYDQWPDYFTVMDRDIYVKFLEFKQLRLADTGIPR